MAPGPHTKAHIDGFNAVMLASNLLVLQH
jgi:hypothetical protein